MDSADKRKSRQVFPHVVHPSLQSVYIPECKCFKASLFQECSQKHDNTNLISQTGGSQCFLVRFDYLSSLASFDFPQHRGPHIIFQHPQHIFASDIPSFLSRRSLPKCSLTHRLFQFLLSLAHSGCEKP